VIRILAGGKKHPSWLTAVCEEYEKRLRKPWNIEWQFVEEEKLPERVARIDRYAFVIILDEHGTIFSSPELSNTLKTPLETGREVVLVIGGAFGHFPPEMMARANVVWSLSNLVFPHQVCRLIVAEQIYRSQEIYLGHSYHHS
jgi:23S rRNA (pseudouridine1915-N3)-methyltransferase